MTDITNILREYFPRWMEIRTKDTSIGAQFLEAFGLQLTDIQQFLDEMMNNRFIGTANIGEVDVIYKTFVQTAVLNDTPLVVSDSKGNIIPECKLLKDFYSTDKNGYVYDTETNILYIRRNYRTIGNTKEYFKDVYIQGIQHALESHHVWNVFDEFGMLLGVYRLNGETNADFKNRILDVFKNPPSHTVQGLKNHLGRMLNIGRESISINPLSRLAETEIDIHGNATPKFVSYIEKLNKLLPFTWDTMRWDEGYWDMFDKIGLDYLPHIYSPDTSMWKDEEFQGGIGDNDDLLIGAPTKEPPEKTFDYKVGLAGTVDRSEEVYVEHDLKFTVHAEGQKAVGNQEPKRAYHTVAASEDVKFSYDVTGYKLYNRTNDEGFDQTADKYDISNIDIVHGNKIMSASNKLFKAKIRLMTKDPAKTPKLRSINVRWVNTSGQVQDTILNTSDDQSSNSFTRNDDMVNGTVYPLINTDTQSCQPTIENTVEIGKGSYSKYFDTMNSWNDGVRQNVKPSRAGLTMVLPQERSN